MKFHLSAAKTPNLSPAEKRSISCGTGRSVITESNIFSDDCLRWLVVSLLFYWGVAAFLLPVTNSDAQVYHLTRLVIAEQAGFWQSSAWNSIRQVIFPWTFDAIHYPFLKLGFAFALPSYIAFLGLLIILFRLLADNLSRKVAYWSVLIVLCMPTIMLQATTTKNDLILVFGSACWFYSLCRFKHNPAHFFLIAAALSIAFTVGSKTSGVMIGAILIVATLWLLRQNASAISFFLAILIPLLAIFGSLETYYLSWKLYHNPLGPPEFTLAHTNQDGLRGACANLCRYYLANISLGIDGIDCHSGISRFLELQCRNLLELLGLSNAGCRRDFSDAFMPFLKDGFDSGSDFGLIGSLAMITGSIILWKPQTSSAIWTTAAGAFLVLLLTCFTVAWMPWNARFLCLSFVLFAVSLGILVFKTSSDRCWNQLIIGLAVICSAISLPLHCGQRRPLDLWNSIFARSEVELRQKPELRPLYADLTKVAKNGRWFLMASENSWTLPFLKIPGFTWDFAPTWRQLPDIAGNDSYALVMNQQVPPNPPVQVIKTYGQDTSIVRLLPKTENP